MFPIEEYSRPLPYARCRNCGHLTLERRAPLEYLDAITVLCINPDCQWEWDPNMVEVDLTEYRKQVEAEQAAKSRRRSSMNDAEKFEMTVETRVRHTEGGLEVGTFMNGTLQEVRWIEEELLTTAVVDALRAKGYTVLPPATDVPAFTVSEPEPYFDVLGAKRHAENSARDRQEIADFWFGGDFDRAGRVFEALPYSCSPVGTTSTRSCARSCLGRTEALERRT